MDPSDPFALVPPNTDDQPPAYYTPVPPLPPPRYPTLVNGVPVHRGGWVQSDRYVRPRGTSVPPGAYRPCPISGNLIRVNRIIRHPRPDYSPLQQPNLTPVQTGRIYRGIVRELMRQGTNDPRVVDPNAYTESNDIDWDPLGSDTEDADPSSPYVSLKARSAANAAPRVAPGAPCNAKKFKRRRPPSDDIDGDGMGAARSIRL